MDLGLHGANPTLLYESFAMEMPKRVIDFSTNTNPLPFKGLRHIDFLDLAAHYPAGEAEELLTVLADVNRCDRDNLLIANGSNELIYLLAAMFREREGYVLEPAYGEYKRSFLVYGVYYHSVFSLEEMPETAAIAFICNPNNPTGAYRKNVELLPFIESHPKTFFVIDEAYRDFLPFRDEPLPIRENLFLLRSLTKIFHLSGLRIGYGLGSAETIAKLKAMQPSWSVNAPAMAVAKTYLEDERYIADTMAFFVKERERVLGRLKTCGFAPVETMANFYLLPVEDDAVFIRFMLRRGLVVRHTRNFSGLDGNYVRIAIKSQEENDCLLDAMEEWKREYKEANK